MSFMRSSIHQPGIQLAIVLAAGRGERLKGLVDDLPKPMVRLKGKPTLEHNIEWLRDHGVRDIYINLHHLPHIIRDYFGSGSKWGVKITYSYEPELLGTAGAIRKIADDHWDMLSNQNTVHDSFLVIYGDNLLEFELSKIVKFHENKKGMATIALYEKDDVTQSGIALLNSDNRIIKFIEKPGIGEAISNLVNTGIYVLDPKVLKYIPPGKSVDFGKHVFPEIIERGESMYGVVVNGNLTAIDTPELLKEAQRMTNKQQKWRLYDYNKNAI